MAAYYNEIEPKAIAWLKLLIKERLIADGEVDTRSIVDVRPRDLVAFEQCHFFAGIGGWSYALKLEGWPDDLPVWTGSCPCQPFSVAGAQRGFDDDRHLWPQYRRLIAQSVPPVVFGEQVASATEWLRLVRGDLEALDYAVGAMPIEAASAGADHLRDRYWFVADTDDAGLQGRQLLPECPSERLTGLDGLANAYQLGASEEREQRGREFCGTGCHPDPCDCGDMADSASKRQYGGEGAAGARGRDSSEDGGLEWVIGADGKARRVKSGIRLLVDGFPNRVGLLRGFGNAIDPRPAREFIRAYMTTRRIQPVSSQHSQEATK